MHLKEVFEMGINLLSKLNSICLLSIIGGLVFVFLSVPLMGIGAAIAVPESILLPLMNVSPILAISMVDLITIGLPLGILFYATAWILKRKVRVIQYYFLATPFVFFMLFGLIGLVLPSEEIILYVAITVAKIIPVIACAVILSKLNASNNGA